MKNVKEENCVLYSACYRLKSFRTITMSRAGTRVDAKKVNSELFTLTYGALVSQLMRDYENVEDVNKQLERMGYNIGIRLIEDFLAKTGSGRCYDFKDTAEKIQ
ncbi:hypothetical protein GE061_012207, partial [Apolygus lucorum]